MKRTLIAAVMMVTIAGQAHAGKSILDFLFPPLPPLPPLPPVVVAAPPAHVRTERVYVQTSVPAAPSYVEEEEVVVTQPDSVSFNVFYESLSPHGEWLYDFDYGRVWRPAVAVSETGWRPYGDAGRWIWTESGWYWNSDYAWGWAPFHYGRWVHHSRYGWVWTPGYQWAPSWVLWRHSDSHCGWAPMPPDSDYVAGVGFTFQGRNVSMSFSFGLTERDYCFVPSRRFLDRHPYDHRMRDDDVVVIYRKTTVVYGDYRTHNGHYVHTGLPPAVVYSSSPVPAPRPVFRGTRTDMQPGGRLSRVLDSGTRAAPTATTTPAPSGRISRILNTSTPAPQPAARVSTPAPAAAVRSVPATPAPARTSSDSRRVTRIVQPTAPAPAPSRAVTSRVPAAQPTPKSTVRTPAPSSSSSSASSSSSRRSSGVSRIRDLYKGR